MTWLWQRLVDWINRGPQCICGKEMQRYEGLGAGFWSCGCGDHQ